MSKTSKIGRGDSASGRRRERSTFQRRQRKGGLLCRRGCRSISDRIPIVFQIVDVPLFGRLCLPLRDTLKVLLEVSDGTFDPVLLALSVLYAGVAQLWGRELKSDQSNLPQSSKCSIWSCRVVANLCVLSLLQTETSHDVTPTSKTKFVTLHRLRSRIYFVMNWCVLCTNKSQLTSTAQFSCKKFTFGRSKSKTCHRFLLPSVYKEFEDRFAKLLYFCFQT